MAENTTPNTQATTATERPKREVITNLRHVPTNAVVPVRWQAAYGTTAAEASTILMNTPAVREAIAKRLNVSEAEVKVTVAKRTDLQEGAITLASDAKAKAAPKASGTKAAPSLTPDERARQWALAYVMDHPNTTFAVALRKGQAHVAAEAKAEALAALDVRIAEAREALDALVAERATLAKAR